MLRPEGCFRAMPSEKCAWPGRFRAEPYGRGSRSVWPGKIVGWARAGRREAGLELVLAESGGPEALYWEGVGGVPAAMCATVTEYLR